MQTRSLLECGGLSIPGYPIDTLQNVVCGQLIATRVRLSHLGFGLSN
jgi:hypothetical protein